MHHVLLHNKKLMVCLLWILVMCFWFACTRTGTTNRPRLYIIHSHFSILNTGNIECIMHCCTTRNWLMVRTSFLNFRDALFVALLVPVQRIDLTYASLHPFQVSLINGMTKWTVLVDCCLTKEDMTAVAPRFEWSCTRRMTAERPTSLVEGTDEQSNIQVENEINYNA